MKPSWSLLIEAAKDCYSAPWGSKLGRFLSKISDWRYAVFYRCDKLIIDNVPRTYSEPEDRIFHAVFTILCQHVDFNYPYFQDGKHLRGVEALKARITEAELRTEFWNNPAQDKILLELYEWYHSINWKEPLPSTWRKFIEEWETKNRKPFNWMAEWNDPDNDALGMWRCNASLEDQQIADDLFKKDQLAEDEFYSFCTKQAQSALGIRGIMWS